MESSLSPAFRLQSDQTDYHVYVHSSEGQEAKQPRPALLFMDGDDQFRYAVDAYRALRAAEELPPLLLVGIGYGASYAKPANRRMRDYTPTAMAGEPGTGGADGFLRFLQHDVWSELSKRYPVDSKNRGIGGHSLGSLLALHAMFQPEPFFDRFLISSPSVWYDDRSILKLAGQLRERQTSLPVHAFLSIGDEDTPSMTGDFKLLEAQLNARPFGELKMSVRHFHGLDHYNVLPLAFVEGLKALYGA